MAQNTYSLQKHDCWFNCSVVDIGSSKYDAVIEDKNGDLLKVQVKVMVKMVFSAEEEEIEATKE